MHIKCFRSAAQSAATASASRSSSLEKNLLSRKRHVSQSAARSRRAQAASSRFATRRGGAPGGAMSAARAVSNDARQRSKPRKSRYSRKSSSTYSVLDSIAPSLHAPRLPRHPRSRSVARVAQTGAHTGARGAARARHARGTRVRERCSDEGEQRAAPGRPPPPGGGGARVVPRARRSAVRFQHSGFDFAGCQPTNLALHGMRGASCPRGRHAPYLTRRCAWCTSAKGGTECSGAARGGAACVRLQAPCSRPYRHRWHCCCSRAGRSADSPHAWWAASCAKKGMKDTGARGTSDEIINLV